MRLFRSKKFWWLAVSIFLILGAGFGVYYFNLLQKLAPKQGENIFLIDDFEGKPRQNILGGNTGTYQHFISSINSRLTHKLYYQKEGGHLEIKYDQKVGSTPYGGGGWCGYYTLLFPFEEDKAQYFDSTAYDYLCLLVKGKVGGEKFAVGLADQDWYAQKGSIRSEEIGKYLKSGKVTTQWQKAVVPLDNYYLDRKRLATVGICFEESLFQEEGEGKGTVYIDNLAFVKDPRSLPGIDYPTQNLYCSEAGVTRPEEQVPTFLAFLQNLRKRLTSGKETVNPTPVHRGEVKLTPRPPSGSMVSKVEPSTPPEPKKTKIKEAKTMPQKPKEGIWVALIKRLKANWLGLKILGTVVLLGLSLVGGKKLYFFLLKKKSELKRKKFAFAHQIKKGLLPVTPPKVDGLSFGVRNISPPEVKGDFYNFIKLDQKKIAITVGHIFGEGGDILAHLIKATNYLHYYAPLYQRPAKLLSVLNELSAKEESNGSFATLIYSVLDLDKNVITVSNAGHEPMMLLHAQSKEVDVYNAQDRTPLGMITQRAFTEQDIQLASGDLVLFHTCGVSKVKNSKDIPFGIDRLKDSIDRNRGGDPDRLIDRILGELTNFTKARFRDNELTLVAIRLDPSFKGIGRSTL